MRRSALILTLSVLLGAGLAAQTPENATPREAYDRAVGLFAAGHAFTSEEFIALAALRQRLVEAGETDMAASLDLLRQAAAAAYQVRDTEEQAAGRLAEDRDELDRQDRFVRDRGFWRGVRDAGLATFTLSTVSGLLVAFTLERNEALLRGGSFSDGNLRSDFNRRLSLGLLASAGSALLSLFPLLWGEARQ